MRFEPVTIDVIKFCDFVKTEYFPSLDGANILYVFDTKKRKSKGKYVIATIKKMNDEKKFLSMDDDTGLTYDYAIYIDKNIWNTIDDSDKKRVIFHEFCHTDVDFDKDNPYNLRDHEIQGFYDEIEFNKDDERWNERLSLIAESIYDNN